jgi:nucleoside-diphosphate-sugar epimerase
MRLLVTGASSFVGAHFCRRAMQVHDVFGLYFSTPIQLNKVVSLRRDLRHRRDIRKLKSEEYDAVIHIACKIKAEPYQGETPAEAAYSLNRKMMEGVLALGKPVIYASSTVVHWDSASPYARSRREDEQQLAESGLPFAVLRPSAPYGRRMSSHRPRHRESFQTLVDVIRRSPLVPIIGSGRYRRQPIHVDDFSDAILALLNCGLSGQCLDAGGGTAHSFNEIVDLLAGAMNLKRRRVSLPKPLFVQLSRLRPDFDPSLIAAIDEDELADPTALTAATGVAPRGFSQGLRSLLVG